MIRCVSSWSGLDGKSYFEEGAIDLAPVPHGGGLSRKCPVTAAPFQETSTDPKLGRRTDAVRQLAITLSGSPQFITHDGRFSLGAGDVLFTENTPLLGDQPWRRVCAVLHKETVISFRQA